MKRSLLIVLAACCLVPPLAPAARAGGANELLQAVPDNAWGMVSVRSLAELDKKLMNLSQMVNAPTAGFSPLAMAKGALGLLLGVNDDGGVALVVMPAEDLGAVKDATAILIPTTNYAELLSLLEPEEVGDGLSKVLLAGNESYVAQKGNFAVAGPTPEAVKAVLAAQTGVVGRLSPYQVERWEKDDLTVWLNLEAFTASPVFATYGETAQATGMDLQWLTEFKSAQLSLRLAPEGIGLGVYYDCQAGSEMGQALASIKPKDGTLLTGLPADSMVFAYGQVGSKEGSAYAARWVEKAMAKVPVAESAQEGFDKIRDASQRMVAGMRSVAFGVNGLPGGADGLVAVTAVLGVDGDATGFLGSLGEMVQTVPGLLRPEEAPGETVGFVAYKSGAEEGGVDHLVFDSAAMGISEDELAQMTKVLGQDGLLFRLSAVGANDVVVTLGGGSELMKQVTTLVKSGQAPLTDRAEVKQASAAMPTERTAEGYLSANGLAELVGAIAKAVGDEVPFEMPPVTKPVMMYSCPTQGGGLQTDVLLPVEVLKAAGQAAMGTMGGGPPAPTRPPPPGGPEGTGPAEDADSPQDTGGG